MSTALDRAFVLAHLNDCRRLLEMAAPRDILGRRSLSAEIADFEQRLAAMDTPRTWTAGNATLKFTGKPVVDNTGIDSAFATAAIAEFEELVRTVRAEDAGKTLAESGPVPDVPFGGRLLITGTVRGSFGFELLEEPPVQVEFMESPTVAALDRVADMLRHLEGREDAWDEVAPASPRALRQLGAFLGELKRADAGLKLATNNRIWEASAATVARGHAFVAKTTVSVEQVLLEGKLLITAVPPHFQLQDDPQDPRSGVTGGLLRLQTDELRTVLELAGHRCRAMLAKKTVTHGGSARVAWTLLSAEVAADRAA